MANRFAKYMTEGARMVAPGMALDSAPAANRFAKYLDAGNVGGLPADASQMEYAVQSARANDAPPVATPARNMSLGATMLEAEKATQAAARQGTDPAVYDETGESLRTPLGEATTDDADQVWFKDETGNDMLADKAKHVVLPDPATGKWMVYERDANAEAGLLTGENKFKSLGRMILPGLVTGPVTAPARAAPLSRAGRVTQGAGRRLAAAEEDLAAFNRAEVPVLSPAFASTPARAMAKGVSETYAIGAPMQGAIENTYRGMADAAGRIADNLSPTASFDQAGASLQRGLDRFRTAGVEDIEPGVLAGIEQARPTPNTVGPMPNIRTRATVQPEDVMSAGAATRARTAEPVRAANQGGMAETARGVPVPAARSKDQTILARRPVEDMEDGEVLALVRAPAGETSFAVRAEALYENADRQLPRQMRENNTANPQLLSAVNARNAFAQIAGNEARTGVSGGVTAGRFGGMGERLRTNVTLPTLRAMRTEIGRALSNFGLYETGLEPQQLKQIYAAISRDIEIAYQDLANRAHLATRNGGNRADRVAVETARAADRALYEFRRADKYFRNGIARMDRFLSVVDAKNPETAAKRLVTAALSGGKGDIAMFRNAMAALRPEERADFAALVIREMGKPVNSARGIAQEVGFSPNSFTTRLQALDPRARAMLFPGRHGRDVDDLFRIANRLSNVERFENVSGSGRMSVNVGGLIAALGSVAAGNVATPIMVGGGGFGLSYILSRPAYARWAVQILRMQEAALRAPNRVTAEIATHMNRLAEMARRDPELLPVYNALAGENGVAEGANGEQRQEQGAGDVQPDQNERSEGEFPAHGAQPTTPRAPFPPPMRLGGPKPEDVPSTVQAPAQLPPSDPRAPEADYSGTAPNVNTLESYPPLRNFEPFRAPELRGQGPGESREPGVDARSGFAGQFEGRVAEDVAPYLLTRGLGAAGRGAAAAAAAKPVTTGVLTGMGATAAGMSQAGDDQASTPEGVPEVYGPALQAQIEQTLAQQSALIERMKSLEEQRKLAVQERDAELKGKGRKGGRGPAYDAKEAEIKRLTDEMARLDTSASELGDQIKDMRHKASPEYADELDAKRKADALAAQEKRAATPTRELLSDYMPYISIGANVAALMFGAGIKGKAVRGFQAEIAALDRRWQTAIAAANAAKRGTVGYKKAVDEAVGLMTEFEKKIAKGPGGTKEALATGASLGLAQGTLPEDVDLARAALGSPLWATLKEEVFKDPATFAGYAGKAGVSVLLGMAAAEIGAGPTGGLMKRPAPIGYGPETRAMAPASAAPAGAAVAPATAAGAPLAARLPKPAPSTGQSPSRAGGKRRGVAPKEPPPHDEFEEQMRIFRDVRGRFSPRPKD